MQQAAFLLIKRLSQEQREDKKRKKEEKKMKFNKKYLSAFLPLIVLVIAGFAVWNSAQSKNIERIIIENKTRALIVESVKDLDKGGDKSLFEVKLRNNGDKPISYYRFYISDDSTKKGDLHGVEKGGLTDGWTLKPNETSTNRFSADKTGKVFLVVAAVLFEDGTGDGAPDALSSLQEIRAGVVLGFQKIIPFIKEETKTSDSLATDTAIGELEKKVRQMDEKEIPDVFKRGFAQTQSYVKFELQALREKMNRKPDFNAAEGFSAKVATMESRLLRLAANTASNGSKKGSKKSGKN
jgi:hypothetical protein